jgi:hypothetical protein
LDNQYVSSFEYAGTTGSVSLVDGVNNFGSLGAFYFYDNANGSHWSSSLGGAFQNSYPYSGVVSVPGAFLQSISLASGYVSMERLTPTSAQNITPSQARSNHWVPLAAWGNDVLVSGDIGSFPVWWVVNASTSSLLSNVTSAFPANYSWIAGNTENNGTVIMTGLVGSSTVSQAAFATFSFGNLRFRYLQEENVQRGCYEETLPNPAEVGGNTYFGGGRICFVSTPYPSATFNLPLLYAVNETTEAVANLTADLPSTATTVEDLAPFGSLLGVSFTITPSYQLGATPFYTVNTATGAATNISLDFPSLFAYSYASQGKDVALLAGSAFGDQADLAVVNETTLAIHQLYGPSPPIGPIGPSLVWTDQTVAGGGGFLTVGGNGLVFYNSSSGQFQAPSGNLSSLGYVQGAAWDGQQFLVVGQGFGPQEGLLAYLYNPRENNLTELTSYFPRGLSAPGSGAGFRSVTWNGTSFLLLGETNSSGQGPSQPLVFSFDPTTSRVTNESAVARSISMGSVGVAYSGLLSAAGEEYVFEEGSSGAYGLWQVSSSLTVTNLSRVLSSTPYQFNGSYDSVSGGIHGSEVSILGYASGILYVAGNDASNHSALVVGYNASLGITNGTRIHFLPTRTDVTTSAFLGMNLLLAGWQPTGPGAPSLFAWNSTTGLSQNLSGAVPSNFLMPGSIAVGTGGAFLSAGRYPSPALYGVLGSPFNLTFQESGLTAGSVWGVGLQGGVNASGTTSSLVLAVTNGTYLYTVAPPSGYVASPSGGTLHVQGASMTEGITFTSQIFPVTFLETGLPAGTGWGVRILGVGTTNTTSNNLTFDLSNGGYAYFPVSPAGFHASPSQGNFTVSGHVVNLTVPFVRELYPVEFQESGLAAGTAWGVQVLSQGDVNTTGGNLTFRLSNGTYSFTTLSPAGFLSSPSQGSFSVSGTGLTISLTFSPADFAVSFYPTGLLPGSPWWLNVTGLAPLEGNNSAPLVLDLPNGGYAYGVGAPPFYQISAVNGTFVVAGQAERINISFVALSELTVQVNPPGAQVTVGSQSVSPNSTGSYHLRLVPGSYFVNASAPGYYAYSDLVSLSAGSNTLVSIQLTSLPVYGWLSGSVSPINASVTAGGHAVPVSGSGTFNVSLAPGVVLVEATAPGHRSFAEELNISAHRTTPVAIALAASSTTTEVRGYVRPSNASVTFNGLTAYVNASGYYFIWLPMGSYDASFYASSYLPVTRLVNLTGPAWINVTLSAAPPASSQTSQGNVSVTGFSVQVNSVSSGPGAVSVNFTASASGNGTLEIQVPLASLANATISEVLASKVYVNGVSYQNFTITITSSGLVVLTVSGIKGDPSLRWVFHPGASPPPATPTPGPSTIPGWLIPAVAGIALVVAAVVGVWAWNRRKRGKSPPPSPSPQ